MKKCDGQKLKEEWFSQFVPLKPKSVLGDLCAPAFYAEGAVVMCSSALDCASIQRYDAKLNKDVRYEQITEKGEVVITFIPDAPMYSKSVPFNSFKNRMNDYSSFIKLSLGSDHKILICFDELHMQSRANDLISCAVINILRHQKAIKEFETVSAEFLHNNSYEKKDYNVLPKDGSEEKKSLANKILTDFFFSAEQSLDEQNLI